MIAHKHRELSLHPHLYVSQTGEERFLQRQPVSAFSLCAGEGVEGGLRVRARPNHALLMCSMCRTWPVPLSAPFCGQVGQTDAEVHGGDSKPGNPQRARLGWTGARKQGGMPVIRVEMIQPG